MAFLLGVQVGSRIDVGGHIVKVNRVVTPTLMEVSVDDRDFRVSGLERVEILPGVFISTGLGPINSLRRLAFEAPQSVRIQRM